MAQKMMGRRAFVGGSLAAGALAALAACSSGSSAGEGSDAAATQPLTIGLSSPTSIDPATATDVSGLTVVWQLFDSLTSYDFAKEELTCLAAEHYEVSDDACMFTFYLREATFHDGAAVTAASFKRAWERIVRPEATSGAADQDAQAPYAYLLSLVEGYEAYRSGNADELSGVTCDDEMTLRVSLSTPYAEFPYILAHPVLGPVPQAAEDGPDAFAQQPIGNGPYQMVDVWESDAETLVLERNEAYYGDVPSIDEVRFAFEDDTAASYRSFQTGDCDVALCPITDAHDAASSLDRSEDNRSLGIDGRFVCATDLTTSMLACNCAVEPLNDSAVRRALSLAIDREYLCETLYRDTRLPADDIVPPTVAGYRTGAWSCAQFDTDRASELLDEDYPLDEDDERDVSVRLMYNTGGGHSEVMQAIADNFADIGVTCELEALEADEFQARLASGDFDLARVDWTADAPTMDAVLFPLFFSANQGSTNCARFASDDVDEQLAKARAELSDDARQSLLQDVDNTVGAVSPVIPLMYHARSYVASNRVEQLCIDPQGRLDIATAELEE